MLNLDFSLSSSKERVNYVNKYVKDKNFTQKELETIANYVLYGKDHDGTSSVDRKEIEIDTRYSSYKKKRPDSLDELLESPTFDENKFSKSNIYKKEKPKIDRELDKDVPGIQELWKTIDYYQHLLDCHKGKIIDEGARKLTDYEAYKINHMVIEMRKQQFILRDSVKPTIGFGVTIEPTRETPFIIQWDCGSDYSIKPLGLLSSNPQRFKDYMNIEEKDYQYNSKAKYILDFTNSSHIYELLEFYDELLIAADGDAESLLDDIIETLDFYIELAELDEVKTEILELKKKKINNSKIQEILKDKFGVTHSTNYISTIYKQKICGAIAEAAQLHYDCYMNREIRSNWKKCTQCGEMKLMDSRVFMRKTRSSDGYNSKCKKCCKENRKK